jgi:enoyl-CoA hydratase
MIERTVHGSTAVLRMAFGKANAFDLELLRALADALERENGTSERAVVLTGTGSIFSAGVDLKRVLDGGRGYLERFLPALDAGLLAAWRFEKPLVGAINGHAIAGGCLLAIACDARVLARGKASFGVPELKVGVPFPLLPMEMARTGFPNHLWSAALLAGRMFGPEECLALGLVDELCTPESLLARAVARAEELGAAPPEAFALTKRLLRLPVMEAYERHGARAAAETLELWDSKPVRAAIASYVERTLKK